MKPKGKGGIVLTVVAGIGMVVTIVLTAKKAPEAQKLKDEALQKKRETLNDPNAKLTFIETVKAEAPCYIPVAASAAVTVGTMIGSQILPQNALNDLNRLHNTYKDINAKVNGPKNAEAIEKMAQHKISQKTDEEPIHKFALKYGDGINCEIILFDATLSDVMGYELDVNKFYKGNGSLSFNQLLQLFKIDKHFEDGDKYGWDETLSELFYGYDWIDFKHIHGEIKNEINGYSGPVIFLEFVHQPDRLTEEATDDSTH